MTDAPLILTLTLDARSQAYFNELRKLHFPPERNYLDAHLTLFHHLPPHEKQIMDDVANLCKQASPLNLIVSSIVSIGNGVAYKIENNTLLSLHRHLQQQWQQWLIPQDRQKIWPHITIQNKVLPERAKVLKAQLEQKFEPFVAQGTGLNLWEYRGGPWSFVQKFEFEGKDVGVD